LLLALLGSFACRGSAPQAPIPRTLEGRTQVSSFVPPFAYEAYVRGELAIAQGAFDEAVGQLELATAAPEEDPYLLSRLAYAQAHAGRPQEAEQTLHHALQLDACSEAVWLTRGALAESAGTLSVADAAYARASESAPLSPLAPIARARALDRAGNQGAVMEVLGAFSSSDEPARARVAFEALMHGSEPAELAYTLETWVAYAAPDTLALERAARWAVEHGFPTLAARVRGHHKGPFPKQLDARIDQALGDRAQLRTLLSQATAEELGGARVAAEFALFAGDAQRAELEATSGLAAGATDALYAIRAQARSALGMDDESLADVRAIGDGGLRRETLLVLLAQSGNPALSRELAEVEVEAGGSAREQKPAISAQ
jgi:tetratricopeptide (TPR) repeat protein